MRPSEINRHHTFRLRNRSTCRWVSILFFPGTLSRNKEQLLGLSVSVLDVHVQVLFAGEALLAVRALEGLNPSMEPQMSFEVARLVEDLHAA